MRSTEIDNSADIIDSRDVIERLEELESEREDLQTAIDEAREAYDEAKEEDEKAQSDEEGTTMSEHNLDQVEITMDEATESLADWDNADEYKHLKALAEQCEGYGDWRYGETLIRDSYFETYAQQLADDSGAIKDNSWPCNCIDWEQAASELQSDYTSVEFDGTTYWMRS